MSDQQPALFPHLIAPPCLCNRPDPPADADPADPRYCQHIRFRSTDPGFKTYVPKPQPGRGRRRPLL